MPDHQRGKRMLRFSRFSHHRLLMAQVSLKFFTLIAEKNNTSQLWSCCVKCNRKAEDDNMPI